MNDETIITKEILIKVREIVHKLLSTYDIHLTFPIKEIEGLQILEELYGNNKSPEPYLTRPEKE